MNNTTKINEHSQKIADNEKDIDISKTQIKENKSYSETNTINKASTSWSGADNWVSAGGVGISW